MKHERRELPLAGMKRDRRGVKMLLERAMLPLNHREVSRCRNQAGVDAMILRSGNFGKGQELGAGS